MKIFGCYGFKIKLPLNWQLEFWFAPRPTVIPWHTHPNINSFLIFLGGKMTWFAGNEYKIMVSREMTWRDMFRGFSIPSDCVHGASGYGLFVNFERWLIFNKTSAAYDLRSNL